MELFKKKWCLAALILLSAGHAANFSEAHALNDSEHVKVRLMSPVESTLNGQDFKAGIYFELEDHWHLYWINPGDSGQAPRLQWNLPPGYSAGEIEWPRPERIPAGPFASYGYEQKLLLTTLIHAPKNTSLTTLNLQAQVKWLVCKDICLPGTAEVQLSIPIRSHEQASLEKGIFDSAQKLIPLPWPTNWQIRGEATTLGFNLFVSTPGQLRPKSASFFPFQQNEIEASAPQSLEALGENQFKLTLRKSDQLTKMPDTLAGLLEWNNRAYKVSAALPQATPKPASSRDANSFLGAVILALLGGILLNLMPCVFPVLSIKAFGLIKHAGETARTQFKHGLLYSIGVLISFWVLAAMLFVFRSAGEHLGWGFQLQSPIFVGTLGALLLVMALNLLGVFEWTANGLVGASGKVLSANSHESLLGTFLSGVLAVVLATPCTAPFMGTALGVALAEPPILSLLIFSSLGIGLALPYFLLCIFPSWGKILPKPGRWMESLKQFLAFPLLATLIWLMSVLAMQINAVSVGTVWLALLILAFAFWMWGRFQTQLGKRFSILIFILALGLGGYELVHAIPAGHTQSEVGWEKFSSLRFQALMDQKKPVFLDFTAAWCVTCKVNEYLALSSPLVREAAQKHGITLMQADWTQADPEITHLLETFHRSGVPLYVLYSGNAGIPPKILPQVLTTQLVLDELNSVNTDSN